MTSKSILIVGKSLMKEELFSALTRAAWDVAAVEGLEEAQQRLEQGSYQVVVVDHESIGRQPWAVLESLDGADPHASILLVVPAEIPVDLFDGRPIRPTGLLVSPIDATALEMAAESAFLYWRLLEENRTLKRRLGNSIRVSDWVGCTPRSREIRNAIATAALAASPVLMLGESGSGRRLAAELVHRHGKERHLSFLPVELMSLPDGELGRLLGEISTGQARGRLPVYGNGSYRPGTVYLSELTALSTADQEVLANLIGQTFPFRLMASADPSIREAARLGRFNRRLFELVSPLSIEIAPLRDRRADIPVLIEHFLKRSCERLNLQPLGIPSQAIEHYTVYDWPGNVAELAMVIERAVSIASAAKFDGTTLPEPFCGPPSITALEPSRLKHASLRELIADIEKRIILQTLERVDGSQKRAAERLRLNPTTLHEKMKRYKILPERSRARSVAALWRSDAVGGG
ncbi:MAG: sigma-54-dependent transcriptional regulator [Acidobacteriota bacterium]